MKFKWLGTTRSLSSEQKSLAAETFGAAGDSISAGKKLIDTRNEHYQALTSIRSQINRFWKENSLPYPEPGIRLIKLDRIDEFNETLEGYRGDLEAGVERLNDHYAEMLDAARQRLGSLFDNDDYPADLNDQFAVRWDFPSVEPPDYLRQLNPDLYREQSRRVAERFDRALQMAEQAFMDELERLVNHLAERLSGDDDGQRKIFRDSAVTNLNEFFERFRDLNVSSDEELEELVDRCEHLIRGVEPQRLRDSETLRRSISTQLSAVQSSLDQLMINRPRRNIIRPQPQSAEEQA